MKNVTFYLGPAPAAAGLTNRNLIITRMRKAGDDSAIAASSDQDLSGTTEFATVALADNTIFQATLQDTKTTGEVGRLHALAFHTGELQFPGPACNPAETLFRIYAMEDLSSSSSSSSQSSSSSSSQSSSSSSSLSSSSLSSSSSPSSSSSASSLSSSSSSASSQT